MKNIFLLLLASLWLYADGTVLKTGQTTIYQAGDDGTYQTGMTRSYTRDDINGIVTDNTTGLMWQDNTVDSAMNWVNTGAYCSNLSLGGHDSWRLPTIKELEMLVDYSRNPTIDSIFQNIALGYYWSSSTYAEYSTRTWGIEFSSGTTDPRLRSGSYSEKEFVRCVRGVSSYASTYVRNADTQTVYDSQTNLTWHDDSNASSQDLNWSNAINYCENLNFAGQTDWRLPNINELHSIIDYARIPAFDSIFQNVALDFYWSSTTLSNETWPEMAQGVSFQGNIGYDHKFYGSHYVRCVRSGQIPNLSIYALNQYNLVKNDAYSLPIVIKSSPSSTNPTLSATGLPMGLTLVNKGSFYAIEGIPTTNGTYNVALTASATGASNITKNIQIVVEELTVSKITNPIVQVNQTDDTTYANTAGYKVTQPLSFKMSFNQPEKVASVKFYFLDANGTKVENDYDAEALVNGAWNVSLPETNTGWVLFGDLPKSTNTRARVKAISFKVTTTDNRVVEFPNALPLSVGYVGLTDGNWMSWNSMNDSTALKIANTLRAAGSIWKESWFGSDKTAEYAEYVNSVVGYKHGLGCFDINDKMFCSWDFNIDTDTNNVTNDTSKIAVKTGDRIRVHPTSMVYLKLGKHEYVINTLNSEDTTEFVVDVNNAPNFAQGFFGAATQIYLKAMSNIFNDSENYGTAPEGFDIHISQDTITGIRGTTAVISKDINGTFSFKTYEGIIDVTKNAQTKTILTGNKLSAFDRTVESMKNVDLDLYEMVYLNSTSDYVRNSQDYTGSLHVTTNDENATFMIIGRNAVIGGGRAFAQEELSEGNYTLKFLPIIGKITPPEIPFVITKEALNISLDGNYSDGLKFNDGWSLLGLGSDMNVTNTQWDTLFGASKIVWKYKDNTWRAYSSLDAIKTAIASSHVSTFDTLSAGEGFWIQSDTNQTVSIDVNETAYQLTIPTTKGWHLKATPKSIAVTSFSANRTDIAYVWAYRNGTWVLWVRDGLQRGFERLDTINAHEGFWVLVR